MATISQVLSHKWPGAQWSMEGDTYAGLVWMDAAPKPTEAEILSFSVEVDGILAQIAAEKRWRDANIVRSEKIEKQDSVTRVHFDIRRIDGASKFKDALYFPDGEMPTENEIRAIQDKRYAAWQAAIAYSGHEIVTGEVGEVTEAEKFRLAKEPVEEAPAEKIIEAVAEDAGAEKPVEEAVESAVDG